MATRRKRRRYPAAGRHLVVLAMETGGRAGPETLEFVRAQLVGFPDDERAYEAKRAWQLLGAVVQTHCASMMRRTAGL
jgi:hypothetical protein